MVVTEHSHHRYAIAAAAVLAAGGVIETISVATRTPWVGIAPWISYSASVVFGLLWLVTATIVVGRRSARWSSIALTGAVVSTVIMLLHGIVLRWAGNDPALLYSLAAALEVLLIKRAWGGIELRRLRRDAARRHRAHHGTRRMHPA